MCVCIYTHTHTHAHAHTYISVRNSRARIAFRYSKLTWVLLKIKFGSKFHAEVATHLPQIKLKTLYTLNIIL